MELPEVTINMQNTHCPKCGNELPMLRKPDGIGQALLGGWTCGQCHSRIDRLGKLIEVRED
ncbi:MAG: hypothetical protein ACREO1_05615 [Arenimonas sp.]